MWKLGYMSSVNADLLSPSRKVREGLSWWTFLEGERWTDLIDWTAFLHYWRKSNHNSSSPTQEEPLYRKRLLEDHAPCKHSYWSTPALMLWWPGMRLWNLKLRGILEHSNNISLFIQCLPLELQGHRWEQQSSPSLSPLTPLLSHPSLPSMMSVMVQYWQWTSTLWRGCVCLLDSIIPRLYPCKLWIWCLNQSKSAHPPENMFQ